jgi:conjugal transfer pilus assembly protein TrbC
MIFSSISFAQEFVVPEITDKDKKEAADFIKEINSKPSKINHELEAQKIVEKAEEVKIQAAKIHANDVSEVAEKISKAQQSKNFKESENWIRKNQNELFAKQTQVLPKVDYDITKEQREKDTIAELLHNYRFKPDEVKKASITHYPLMIFVSSSIPRSSLKDLMIQAKQMGGILVFRGIIGSLRNTQEFLAEISKENVSAIIDPRLFDIFQVKLVPTFVLLSNASQDCFENDCQFTPRHDRITGNITLKYALEQIEAGKGDSSSTATEYLLRIHSGGKSS